MLDDWFAERGALVGVVGCIFQRSLCHTDGLGSNANTTCFQIGQCHFITLIFLTQDHVICDLHIIEMQCAGIRSFLAKLFLDTGYGISRGICGNQKGCDAFFTRGRIRHRKNNTNTADFAGSNKLF